MKPNVLDSIGDLFSELCYIYQGKYNEEKEGINTKSKTFFNWKKLRLTDDYQYKSEEEKEEEKEQQTSKKRNKKEPHKKPAKDDAKKFNKSVNREETDKNSKIFQKCFSFQRPSDMLKELYKTNDKNKNNKLVDMIKSGLSDLKNEIENMSEEEKKFEKPNEIINVVEKNLELSKQNQLGQGLKILTPD